MLIEAGQLYFNCLIESCKKQCRFKTGIESVICYAAVNQQHYCNLLR